MHINQHVTPLPYCNSFLLLNFLVHIFASFSVWNHFISDISNTQKILIMANMLFQISKKTMQIPFYYLMHHFNFLIYISLNFSPFQYQFSFSGDNSIIVGSVKISAGYHTMSLAYNHLDSLRFPIECFVKIINNDTGLNSSE